MPFAIPPQHQTDPAQAPGQTVYTVGYESATPALVPPLMSEAEVKLWEVYSTRTLHSLGVYRGRTADEACAIAKLAGPFSETQHTRLFAYEVGRV